MILIISLICVPIMLFPKPIMQYLNQQKKHPRKSSQGFDELVEEVINGNLKNSLT